MAKIALISEVAARSSSPPATIRWLPSTGSWSRVNMRRTLPQRRPCMPRIRRGRFQDERRDVAARTVERVEQRRGRVAAVNRRAVADEQMLGQERPQPGRAGARRRRKCTPAGPRPDGVVRARCRSTPATTSPRGSGHHSARSFHGPRSRFRTRERRVAAARRGGRGTATPSRFAIASPSRGWATNSCSTPAGSPSAAARSSASGASTGSTSQTRPSWTSACEARSSGSSIDPGEAQRVFG